MEPHATVAWWDGGRLTMHDSIQGSQWARQAVAATFGIDEADVHIVYPHVGGGFGAKGLVRPHAIATALAADVVGRPVKLAVTRRQMFSLTGYRTPTIQRLRLGATADGDLTAISHEVCEQTSTMREFAEQTAVATRHLYAAPNRRTTHRLVALDVPTPSWMRAPGETPGCSPSSARWTSSQSPSTSTPSSSASATNPRPTPSPACRSRRGTSSTACARAPAGSAGTSGGGPAGGGTGRWLVGSGVAVVDLPGARRAVHRPRHRQGRRALAGRDRRRRHRHRRAHRPARLRRRTRSGSTPTRSCCASATATSRRR